MTFSVLPIITAEWDSAITRRLQEGGTRMACQMIGRSLTMQVFRAWATEFRRPRSEHLHRRKRRQII